MTAKEYFLKHAVMLVDTREKENFELLSVFRHFGLEYDVDTFKTGDYSFRIDGYDYKDKWLAERKGSLTELYGNVMAANKDKTSPLRNNLEEELRRKMDSGVQEFILFVQGARNLAEIKGFTEPKADKQGKRAGQHIYATIMSWAAANRYNFKVCCQKTQAEIAAEMINYAYYFWSNDMKEKFGDNFVRILQGAKR